MPNKLTTDLLEKEALEVYFDLDMVTWRKDEPLTEIGFDTMVIYTEEYEEDKVLYVNSAIIQTMNDLYDKGVKINILTAALYEKESVLKALQEAMFTGEINSFANADTLLADFLERNNLFKDSGGYILEKENGEKVPTSVEDLIDNHIADIDTIRYTTKSNYTPLATNTNAFLVDDDKQHYFSRMIYFHENYFKITSTSKMACNPPENEENFNVPYIF